MKEMNIKEEDEEKNTMKMLRKIWIKGVTKKNVSECVWMEKMSMDKDGS